MSKPRLFVASSSESLDVAWAVQENLERIADVEVWDQSPQRLSRPVLVTISAALENADFGIFILNPDDIVELRGDVGPAARDNVIFELGLFVARLGIERCFILLPAGTPTIRVPTDLLGVTMGEYRVPNNGNLKSATGPFCNRVRSELIAWNDPAREPTHQFHERFRSVDWGRAIGSAHRQIDVSVFYFDSWVNANREALLDFFIKPGSRLRVFVSDPRQPELFARIQNLFPESKPEILMDKITKTGHRFASVLRDAGGDPDRFEFYLFDDLLTYSAQCFDEERLVISTFEMFRESRIDSPAIEIDLRTSSHLTSYWQKEIEGLLKQSTRIDPSLGIS